MWMSIIYCIAITPMQHELVSPKGLLFDLDGTLLDTADDLACALNRLLDEHGCSTKSREHYRPIASHGAMGMLKLGFPDIAFGSAAFEELRKRFLLYYAEQLFEHTRLFEGIGELIETLDSQNIPWGIVTNKPTHLTLPLLKQFSEFNTAGTLICGDTLTVRKPHPEPLLVAASELNIPVSQLWYVGDAERDMQAARAAGMTAVLAEYGYICQSEQPEQWVTDLRISHPNTLTKTVQHKI